MHQGRGSICGHGDALPSGVVHNTSPQHAGSHDARAGGSAYQGVRHGTIFSSSHLLEIVEEGVDTKQSFLIDPPNMARPVPCKVVRKAAQGREKADAAGTNLLHVDMVHEWVRGFAAWISELLSGGPFSRANRWLGCHIDF